MTRSLKVILLCIITLIFSSCVDKKGRELKSKIDTSISITSTKGKLSQATVMQYRETELQFNQRYVDELKKILDNSFEKQLDRFDNDELGFFSTYGNMFRQIFWSKQKLEDRCKLLSTKYFNTLDVEKETLSCYENYIKDISSIRNHFQQRKNGIALPDMVKLELPRQDIYLGDLQKHARNNLVIELISSNLVIWLIILLFLQLLSLIFAVPTNGLSAIAFVLSIILSVCLSMRNDKKLLNTLREQNSVIMQADYSSILNNLNENTYKFYEK